MNIRQHVLCGVVAILTYGAMFAVPTYGFIAVVLVMVVIGVAWEVVRSRLLTRRPYQPLATTKNVTPHEPALPAGEFAPEVSAAPRAPSVIVVESPDGADLLGARLQALDRLRADGLVTDQEYEAKRAQLIADF